MTSETKIRAAEQAGPANMAIAPRTRRAPVDFIVLGAMRAGTTTLHGLLSRHPAISMARDKETDYFIAEKNWPQGADWYRQQFDPARALWGEASPNYAKGRDFPGVPERVARHAPKARLIYLVRDPLRRAVSQYGHSWTMGLLDMPPGDLPDSHEYLSLIDASCYARQLDLWRAHFDGGQMLIVDFDALIADPQGQIDRVLAHIGAAPMQIDALNRENGGGELSRVPRGVLKLAHGPLRPVLTGLFGHRSRAAIRRLLARGPERRPPAFPEALLARMRTDLAEDAAQFRAMTGMEQAHWSV
ncbi:sulfotransferase [uncultured Paracoccus sp.]|uniref:sulfotransferase family protein n=1 Tax=uncultured Paracoccus sp. TaxID=189685 RepID=UPI00262887C7|nr:sulfotransferase [uncultured Paracoccus sp.]